MIDDLNFFFTDFACDVLHVTDDLVFKGILKSNPYQLDYDQTRMSGYDFTLVVPTEDVQAIQRHDTLKIENATYRVLDERIDGTGLSYLSLEKINEN